VDLAKWASWLAAGGYTNKAGWAKIAEAARAQVRAAAGLALSAGS
jgi:hypothetical protein